MTAVNTVGESPFSNETCEKLNGGVSADLLDSFSPSSPVSSVAIGDFNGDNFPDLAVGSASYSKGQSTNGKIDIYLGGGVSSKPVTITGTDCAIGYNLAVADLNNDGFDDIVTGNPTCNPTTSGDPNNALWDEGQVLIYAGGQSIPTTPAKVINGSNVPSYYLSERLGASLATVGDVNGDGFIDVAIGAPMARDIRSGRVLILYGSTSFTLPTNSVYGVARDESIGYTLAPAGDINGDGFADIAVGGNDEAWTPSASIVSTYVIYGGLSPQLSNKISNSYNVIGLDFNGDGFSDLNAGCLLFPGGTTFPTTSLEVGYCSNLGYSYNLDNLGDLNNDGSEELLAGSEILFGIDNTYATPFAVGTGIPTKGSGDWNVDGVPDLIGYDSTTNNVNIYSTTPYLSVPRIQLASPAKLSSTYFPTSTITGKLVGGVSKLLIYGQVAQIQPDGSFSQEIGLADGVNQIEIIAEATNGTLAKQTFRIDRLAPPAFTLSISKPLDSSVKYHTPVEISGTVSNMNTTVTINGVPAVVTSGTFSTSVALVEGSNVVTVIANDEYGQTTSQSLTVNLVTNGPVKGIVTDGPGGQPLEGVSVSVTDSFGTYTAITDDAGAYTITGNVQGDFTITFTKAGYFTITQNGNAPAAGGSVAVDTQLSQPMTLSISSPADGEKINATPVTVIVSCNNLSATVTVNGVPAVVSGELFAATLDLPEGANVITATADDGGGQVVSDNISVIVATTGTITGTVTSATTGLVVAGATVAVTDAKSTVHSALTAQDGTYSISDVASGTYNGTISKTGHTDATFSGSMVAEDTVVIDRALLPAAPTISNIQVRAVSDTAATITWTTDQLSDSLVEYGQTTAYGLSNYDVTMVAGHSVTLTGLSPSTTYVFQVTSAAASGLSQSAAGNQPFTTLAAVTITNTAVSNITGDTATITWTTDQPADSLVQFGLTTEYSQTSSDPALVTVHSITLTGLTPATTHHYQVISTAANGVSGNSVDSTFTTPAFPIISNITVTNITGNAATINWTTDQPATSQVDYGESAVYDLAVADTMPATAHTMALSNLISGTTYHFAVTSANSAELSSSSIDYTFNTQQVMTLTITAPVEGETVSNSSVLVQGTVIGAGGEIGVTVNNDRLGVVSDGYFAVNDVPLLVGGNTIVVKAVDADGNIAEAAVNVNYQPGVGPIKLTADVESGLAPLTATFRIDAGFDMATATTNVSAFGPVAVDSVTFINDEEFIVQVSTPGIYVITAEVTDSVSNMSSDSLAMFAMDGATLDALLTAKWVGMKTAMATQDVEGALPAFLETSKDKYREIYTNLLTQLPQLAADMQNIEMIYAKDGRAKYRIIRQQIIEGAPVDITYYIYFNRDANGIWKIDEY